MTRFTFNEWVDVVTANPRMIYYVDDIENSPLVRNSMRDRAATAEVAGITPPTQTTSTHTVQAAEQQQPNEAAAGLPIQRREARRTSDDATTTENSKPTARQTRMVTPMTTPPVDAQDNARTGTNTQNAAPGESKETDNHSATQRRNMREFHEYVPRDRRYPYELNPRRFPAQLRRVTEVTPFATEPQQQDAIRRDARATSEASNTTSHRTGAWGYAQRARAPQYGERHDEENRGERMRHHGDVRPRMYGATQRERDAPQFDVRDWHAVRGAARYLSTTGARNVRLPSPQRQANVFHEMMAAEASAADSRDNNVIQRPGHRRYDIHDVRREVKALSRKFDRMMRTSKPKTNINVFNEPPRRRRRNTSSSNSE